jgi:hypothetical protein
MRGTSTFAGKELFSGQWRREVFGLKGAKSGLRFPKWQADSDGGLLPQLPRLFTGMLTRTASTNYKNR